MIWLISPPKGTKRPDNNSAPVGLCYIQAYLDSKGIKSKIFDLEGSLVEKFMEEFMQYKPEIVGITCFTDNRTFVFSLVKKLKEINSKTIIVLGGHHADAMADQILKNFPVDYIVKGEGEIAFYDIVKNKPKEKIIVGKPVSNLDELPFPSYRDLNMHQYKWEGKPSYDLVTSRGCPFSCTYCSSSEFWGHKWRFRSPKNVVDEIESVVKKGITHFRIVDDNFTMDKNRAIEICKEILKRKLKIEFWIQSRVSSVDYELALWLKNAGCYLIAFGIESGSNEILKNINKMYSLKQIYSACNACKGAGIKINAYFMVGNKGETWKTINESAKVIRNIRPDTIGVSIMQIYPGTAVNDLPDEYWLTDKRPPNSKEASLLTLRLWQIYLHLINKVSL